MIESPVGVTSTETPGRRAAVLVDHPAGDHRAPGHGDRHRRLARLDGHRHRHRLVAVGGDAQLVLAHAQRAEDRQLARLRLAGGDPFMRAGEQLEGGRDDGLLRVVEHRGGDRARRAPG